MKANAPSPRYLAIAAGLLLLGGCAAVPKPAPPPAPVPTPTPAPLPPPPLPKPPADWRDAAQTPGTWRWAMIGGRSTASYVGVGGAPMATLTCDRVNARVLVARRGDAAASVAMALTTTFGTRPLSSDPLRASPGWVVAELHTNDPMLDSVAFSRGRFVFDVAGLEPLYLPSWPEISRVVEDCR